MKVKLLRRFRRERIWIITERALELCFSFCILEPHESNDKLKIIWEEFLCRCRIIRNQSKRFHYLLTSDFRIYTALTSSMFPEEYETWIDWINHNRKKYEKYSRKYWNSSARLRRAIVTGTID